MADESKGIAAAMPAIGIGLDIANAIGGWFGGNKRQEQQYKYQRKLNEQMAELQRQNWDYTNAENQRKHYENAGLNVGLMYGSSGGGGATMGGGSGGSAGMAETPKFMGMGIQGALAKSTIALNEAQADKLKAEADKTRGVDTDKVIEESKGIGLDNTFKSGNLETALDTSKQILANESAKNETLVNEGKISKIEAEQREKKLKTEINNVAWDTLLKKAQRNNVNQQTIESIERVKQKWEELNLKSKELEQGQQRINIDKFKAELQSEYPGLWNTLGKMSNDVLGALRGLDELFGFSPKDYHRKIK